MPDGSIALGPKVVIDAYARALNRSMEIDRKSKYHSGQVVRVKDDVIGIINTLIPTYNYTDARHIALLVAGKYASILGVDELTNNGVVGTYYSIEPELYHGFLVLPESLLEV